ncbi:alpha/beta hydrolase [Flavobacterium sp. SM15]|uniref:alpha/beta fold hydrolase n=1 Tax=Flavobacterium sp. SM15 TaxID=2908005 RepID=UPI001EDC43F1|nr:alpha/beta hydrolase [Flavobacterium sp. SM15]MCG2611684.1 alpha/beta hydrolase [Flavobacterium sp. SM15]
MKIRILNIILFVLFFSFSNGQNLKNGDYFENIGGLKINYSIRGKGPVMIVGHLNSGKIGYQATLKPLEDHFTMVYYDPRGTGKSQMPNKLEDYKQDSIVSEIEYLRRHLNINKIWIFGHSDQSAVALEYALKYPNNTAGLLLIGTSFVGTQKESMQRRKNSETKRTKESEWFKQVIKDWDYMIEHKTNKNELGKDISESPIKWWCYNEESSQRVIQIVRLISAAGRRKPINNVFPIETEKDRLHYLNNQKKFPSLKVKTLIINGKYDTNNPPEFAKQLQVSLPYSTLILIDKAGHFPWIENSDFTFKEIKKWLSKNL